MLAIWIQASRPKTLPAAAVPVLVGTAHAWRDTSFQIIPALICLLFALLIQVGTNFANDYYDGVRGTDSRNRRGPVRAVASGLVSPALMFRATLCVLGCAFALGLLLVFYGGWWLVLIGVLSVLLAISYTGGPYPLAYLGLGDIFVVLFFGIIPVAFTYYVQTGHFGEATLWTGLGCGLLANNLLVANNYRDAEGDAQSGKRTLVVRFGRDFARKQFFTETLLAITLPLVLLSYNYSWTVMIPFLLLLLPGALLGVHFARSGPRSGNLILAWSSLLLIAYGVLTSIGIVL